MAGEWIKVELSTPDKPEVLRIARILGIDKDAAFGKLIRLWGWFDRNSVDGVVDGVVDNDVDALCYQDGFCSALVTVGWLVVDSDNSIIEIPNFSRHNGESAKKRARKTEAQAKWRSNKDAFVDNNQSTSVSTSSSTREEKRRIVNIEETIPDWIPLEAWNAWVAMRVSIKKPLTSRATKRAITKLLGFKDKGYDIEQILDQAENGKWTDLYEPKEKPVFLSGNDRLLRAM